MDRSHPRVPKFISVWRSWQRTCFGAWGSSAGLGADDGSRPAAQTNQVRALGCGRSSTVEPRAVNSLVPVRFRPVTPKRMQHRCVANSSGRVPGSYSGMSGFEPLATHQADNPLVAE